jgi:hypothetical protein
VRFRTDKSKGAKVAQNRLNKNPILSTVGEALGPAIHRKDGWRYICPAGVRSNGKSLSETWKRVH